VKPRAKASVPNPADTWLAEAEILRRRGAGSLADVLESCARDFEAWLRERDLELLTLDEAVQESGYSYSSLEKSVRSGRLPNAGKPGRPRIRRCDLPRKVNGASWDMQDKAGPDLAGAILRTREYA
jgi:hypothetical protein